MRFFIFLTFFLKFTSFTFAQKYDEKSLNKKAFTAFQNKEYDLSIYFFSQIELNTKKLKTKSYSQHALGHLYGKEKLDINKGVYWCKKNINTLETNLKSNYYFTYITSCTILGDYYLYLGKRDSAEFYLKKGSAIYLSDKKRYKKDYPIIRKFNTFFYRRKEYNLSKDILNQIIHNNKISYTTLSDYLSLCIQIEDSIGIRETLKKINLLEKKNNGYHLYYLGENSFNKMSFLNAITQFQLFINQYNFYYKNQKGYVFSNDEIKLRHYYIARTYLKIAQCYNHLSDSKKQLNYLKKAEKEIKKGLSFPTQDMNVMAAEIYRALDIYYHNHHFISNINYIDLAQDLIEDQLLIHEKDTNQVLLNQLMLQNFYTAEFSNKQSEKEVYYWKAYLMLKKFIGKQYSDDDQLYQFKNLKEIQEQLILFYTNLFLENRKEENLLKVLEMIENSKSNILYKRSLGLDNMTFEQYINTPNIDSVKNQINSSPLLSSSQIRSYFLKNYEDKGFVSYYPTSTELVIVGYINDHFFLEKKELPNDWNELVDQTHKEVSKSNLFINRSFNHQLYQLGDFLLPNALKYSSIKRVVFSPSGNLNFIPFEILKTKKGYYLEKWAISYSFSLHHEYSSLSIIKSTFDPIEILGVAPYNKINLPFSLEEVKAITPLILSDKEATMENTLKILNQCNILHLATHTTINKTAKDSNIEFYPLVSGQIHTLSFNEIANKDLSHLQLVSLSSCHSGDGPYIDGEGTLSLQRAFAYANVHSILASKWDVNDEVSSIIMASFYKYLRQGWEKDIALQKAKKEFWENNPSIKINPIYWGNIVLFGEADAIASPSFQKYLFQYFPFDF